MSRSEWQKLPQPNTFLCKKCGSPHIWVQTAEDDEEHEDYHYRCEACNYTWWVDGIDY